MSPSSHHHPRRRDSVSPSVTGRVTVTMVTATRSQSAGGNGDRHHYLPFNSSKPKKTRVHHPPLLLHQTVMASLRPSWRWLLMRMRRKCWRALLLLTLALTLSLNVAFVVDSAQKGNNNVRANPVSA